MCFPVPIPVSYVSFVPARYLGTVSYTVLTKELSCKGNQLRHSFRSSGGPSCNFFCAAQEVVKGDRTAPSSLLAQPTASVTAGAAIVTAAISLLARALSVTYW